MLHTTNHRASNLKPINTIIQLLIHQSHNRNIVPSDQVQAMWNFARGFRVIWWTYDALDCL